MQNRPNERSVFVSMLFLEDIQAVTPQKEDRGRTILEKSVCYTANTVIKKISKGVCTHLDGNRFLTVFYEHCESAAVLALKAVEEAIQNNLHMHVHYRMGVLTDLEDPGWPSSPTYSRHINRTVAYLEQHYDQIDNLSEISEYAGLSPAYLSSRFKEEVGVGVIEYLNQIRLEHARELIADSNMPLKSIIYSVGFTNYPYFSRLFRKKYHISPSDYRKKSAKEKRALAV